MRRLKLGLNQTELGNALGVTFQQIQKYERGTDAVASTRISDLCRALEMTPNDLFDVSSKMDGDVSKLSSWTMQIALKLEDASLAVRQAIDAMLGKRPDALFATCSSLSEPTRIPAVCPDPAWRSTPRGSF
jgi:DNA-binding Xre family transcriptional regulator